MASALDDLLADFQANAGTMPQVNPPEAAAVLATQTAPEVAGAPEPEPAPEPPPAPTEKPAEVRAAESAGKTRRTAAVVQAELDAALKEMAELRTKLASGAVQAATTAPPSIDLPGAIRLVATLAPAGTTITIAGAGAA